jgi:hypothetical protein
MFNAARIARALSVSVLIPALLLAPAIAEGASSGPVTLTLLRSGSDLSEISWSASGAIQDGGTWTTENRIFGGRDGVSDAFVVAQVLTTETGAQGAFHLRFQGIENRARPFSGTWQLVDGTGAYVGVIGTGTWYAESLPTGELAFFLSGSVHH